MTRRADGLWSSWLDARPAGLGQGALRRADHPRCGHSAEPVGREEHQGQAALPAEAAELNRAERKALTEVTRQRAESLFVLDVQIGRTISRLSRSGQLANTVIMFTSDNGFYLGEHRKRMGKINLHEPSLRVPPDRRRPWSALRSAVRPGDHRRPGADPGGVRRGAAAESRRRRPLGAHRGRRLRVGPSGGDRGDDDRRSLRASPPRWLAAEHPRPAAGALEDHALRHRRTELYDLATDPLELRNLSRVPKYADELRDLRKLTRIYRNCRGKACAANLPPKYRVSPAESRRDHPEHEEGDAALVRGLSAPPQLGPRSR